MDNFKKVIQRLFVIEIINFLVHVIVGFCFIPIIGLHGILPTWFCIWFYVTVSLLIITGITACIAYFKEIKLALWD